jgi:hypothetical protein
MMLLPMPLLLLLLLIMWLMGASTVAIVWTAVIGLSVGLFLGLLAQLIIGISG